MTVSREIAPDAGPAPAAVATVRRRARACGDRHAVVQSPTPHSGIPDSDAPAKPQDPEELYEEVMARSRRDLIAELEQNGHLLRDTF